MFLLCHTQSTHLYHCGTIYTLSVPTSTRFEKIVKNTIIQLLVLNHKSMQHRRRSTISIWNRRNKQLPTWISVFKIYSTRRDPAQHSSPPISYRRPPFYYQQPHPSGQQPIAPHYVRSRHYPGRPSYRHPCVPPGSYHQMDKHHYIIMRIVVLDHPTLIRQRWKWALDFLDRENERLKSQATSKHGSLNEQIWPTAKL